MTPMEDLSYKEFQQQIAELTRLAAAQIQVSMADADQSVNQLTDSFTEIVNQDRALRDLVQSLPEDPEIAPIKHAIASQSNAIGSNVRNSIIAFQFFDRLCQRLDHSIQCLRELSTIEETNFLQHMGEIERLKTVIYQSYTMEDERLLYDQILADNDFDQAVKTYLETKNSQSDDDDIELF